ncbi:MarP family serine protease [Paenarthrobacter sp. PH39-S1]|uniref:MarP family serine protease n=1 Tax=Paenarthrobacter sp. PH39-S1 TaxID=3046204 RepID=UPI0024BA9894|nr:MarP family serine protease [Paenarthrobacter sp. PH39-S1]MDJ0355180.1 MarP family serine protease [Paenarthrobacter sp. PH39-S1]
MFGFTVLDLVLLLWLIGQLIYGLRVGLVVSLGGILGFVAGAAAAFFAVPFVSSLAGDSGWRTVAVIAAVLVLVVLGHTLGIRLGTLIGRRVKFHPVRAVDRLLGGALNLGVGALMISVLAFSVSNLGIPFVSTQLGQSKVIGTIDSLTPTPVKSSVAQLRSIVLNEGIPQLFDQLGPVTPMNPPNTSTDTPALNSAAQSILKITGTAFQCGQNQTGSGFVVSPGRVVTNAHVVAGVSRPVVELPGGGSLPGRVVSFDPQQDLAVIAVDGLQTATLPLGSQLQAGDGAAFAGYPHGGPFTSEPATVQTVSNVLVPDIYGQNPAAEEVYQLAADVQPGNSGGPLLNNSGQVVGVVFARATAAAQVGYAFTLTELAPVVHAAPGLDQQVSAGQCTKK